MVANLRVSNFDSFVSAGTHGNLVLRRQNALDKTRIRARSRAFAAFLWTGNDWPFDPAFYGIKPHFFKDLIFYNFHADSLNLDQSKPKMLASFRGFVFNIRYLIFTTWATIFTKFIIEVVNKWRWYCTFSWHFLNFSGQILLRKKNEIQPKLQIFNINLTILEIESIVLDWALHSEWSWVMKTEHSLIQSGKFVKEFLFFLLRKCTVIWPQKNLYFSFNCRILCILSW